MTKLILGICLLIANEVFAQDKCTKHYFKSSHKVSTQICMGADNRFGKAYMFKLNGDTVKIWHIRRIGGNASVSFDYYENGAVKKASFSDHPDGGIQWYREWISYDEQGNQTSYNSEKYPFEPLTHITLDTTRKSKPQKKL